jgi:hypothetical protein
MKRLVLSVSVLVWLVILPWTATAVEFKPFTSVQNVCPDCDTVSWDVVTLTDDTKVEANVIAENVDFLVVEKYGEIRAIPHDQIKSTNWVDDREPSGLKEGDQIVLNNGTILSGNITDESEKPGHFQLKSSVGGSSFTVFKTQVDALYRDGKIVNVTVPSTDGNEGSSSTQ